MRVLLLPLFVLVAPSPIAQLVTTASTELAPDEVVIDVFGGHGTPGGPDSQVSVLAGPAGGWLQAFGARHFDGARNGPQAAVLANAPFAIVGLSTHPDAQWIAPDQASGAGSNQVPGLFAIEFDVPVVPLLDARLDLWFSVDEALGLGPNQGVYLNEQPVPDTKLAFGADGQHHFTERKVTELLQPGKNTLYLYMVNNAFFGGLLFHARIRINSHFPDDCVDALPAWLGEVSGSTIGFTTSPAVAGCGILNERWYWFVPPASGTLTATLDALDPGSGYHPGLGVYRGGCGTLNLLGCAGGSPTTSAVWTGPVKAGVPIQVAVGGMIPIPGDYRLRLTLLPKQTGLVYSGNGHLYTKTPTAVSLGAARAQALTLGGYLAAINDAAENAWIQSQLAASEKLWIGLSDEISEGTYLWDSGEPFAYSSWNATEPNDHPACGGEDYAELEGGGKWNDLASGGVTPCQCCAQMRVGLIEIPASGLASVLDLGGGCGPASIAPWLYSEPHQIGKTADMAVIGAQPFDTVLVYRSPAPLAPGVIGACTVHLNLAASTLVFAVSANVYGSVPLSVATPNNPALIGLTENWQAQLVPAAGGSFFTNGLELRKGN